MKRWAPVAAGVVLALGLAWTARTPDAGVGWRLAFVALHLGAFAALVAWLARARPDARVVVVGAVVFRLCVFPMLPSLSDDGYRYLWDGRVVAELNASPYAHRPSDDALAPLRARVEYERMNSAGYYSVYPPASQVGFAVAVAIGGDDWRAAWWAWKALLVLAELGAIWTGIRVFGAHGAALYAWSPLAVIEVAGQGHTEALLLAGAALALTASRRWPWGSVGLAVAGGVKLYPLAWLPLAWRREGWRGVAASAVLLAAMSVPLWSPTARAHVAESLGLFFGTFDEYAAPYLILKSALYPAVGDAAGAVSSRILALGFVAVVAASWLVDDGTRRSVPPLLAVGVLAFAVTASTLHPWYWLPVLFLTPALRAPAPVLWVVAWASVAYLGYVVPAASLIVTVIGWSGAVVLFIHDRSRHRRSPTWRPANARRGSGGTT